MDPRPFHLVKFKASHNSFERDERPVTEQLVWSDRQPHQAGCRGLELDLRESPNLWSWSVHHDEYQGRVDAQLVEYLRHLRTWSLFEPRHDVITITLDVKAQARNRRQFPRYLDATIEEFLGRDRLFSPAALMGSADSLVAGAMASGWPALDELRDRFILVLSGDEPTKASYASSSRDRLCFADQRLRDGDPLPSLTEGDRVFFNLNATEDWAWSDPLHWFAGQQGFITRAYVANSADLWDRLLAADVNILSTDKVRNHPWARVGDQPFVDLGTVTHPPTI
ncbi:MAG: Ca2+-dependent phosphoinositide-specific phospholipase C [Acidimicrobiia bacterium]